ncbi:MAG: hypothetical protein QW591_03150 [Candidatus Micrarchaeaceae archaeon]
MEGEELNEVGVKNNKILVKMNKEFFMPLEADNFIDDYSKARTQPGQKPKTSFKELVKIMVNHDLRLLIIFLSENKERDLSILR